MAARSVSRVNDTSIRRLRIGQNLNFEYENNRVTVHVLEHRSTGIIEIIEYGKNRGERKEYERIEILDCLKLFGSSVLHNLHKSLATLE